MDKLLSCNEVQEITGMSRSTIWRREALGQFPRRLLISSRKVAWRASEVQAWIASYPANNADVSNQTAA